ncbi:hypothetical protein, partial [Planifilum fimeticola]
PIQYCLADGSGFETYHPVLILFVLSSDFDKKRLLTCYLCQQSHRHPKGAGFFMKESDVDGFLL